MPKTTECIFCNLDRAYREPDFRRARHTLTGAGRDLYFADAQFPRPGEHKVLSSRHPEELRDLVASLGPLAQAGTVDQAIAFGDVVLITVPYGALPEIGREHAAELKGKIVAVFGESTLAMQRVLKLPSLTRRLNASSQLNGIFSIRPSARGGSRRILSLRTADAAAGTGFHLSSNEMPESRPVLWMRF